MTFGEAEERLKQKQSFRNVHMHPAAVPPINTSLGVNVRKTENMYLLLETRFIHPDFNDLC